MDESLYIAIDLGAGSGRVFLVGVADGELLLKEAHRFYYPPREKDGHLRWDFQHIFDEIKTGLKVAGEIARELNRPIRSIGVDSWGVDHGFINAEGKLLRDPVCYRDERTNLAMAKVFTAIPREKIFEKTGIQFLPFNTLFQLAAENGDMPSDAKMLLMPDLTNYCLTGRAATEYTNATTTQMISASAGNWDEELVGEAKLSTGLFTEIIPAGTDLGTIRPELASELGLQDVRVIAPATHDTASAVIGAPLEEGWAYISSGTWSLVGVELNGPLINKAVQRHNFTNEGGAYGTIRFLKNVMGLWLLESCRKELHEEGIDAEHDTLLAQVETIEEFRGFIFPDDQRFMNPKSMTAAIREQLDETGQTHDGSHITLTKIILDSLAFRYASVVKTIEELTGEQIKGVQIVGGGSRNNYLDQMTADACGLPVTAGPVEATVIGNAMVQAIAVGRFSSLKEARRHTAQNIETREFTPQNSPKIDAAEKRYREIEAKYK